MSTFAMTVEGGPQPTSETFGVVNPATGSVSTMILGDPRWAPYQFEIWRLIDQVDQQGQIDRQGQTDRQWWPDSEASRALGCPPWLAVRLAEEAAVALDAVAGGGCAASLPGLRVLGTPALDRVGPGTLVLQDLVTGWSYPMPVSCHPAVPPHRWRDLTLALEVGLNLGAALDIALIPV